MDLFVTADPASRSSFPRMRGDGPSTSTARSCSMRFPPHARGWTLICNGNGWPHDVSPACAGMDPERTSCCRERLCFPRMRGDGPFAFRPVACDVPFPPHARGWTCVNNLTAAIQPVSPACAGMDLSPTPEPTDGSGFPRMRGDGPYTQFDRLPGPGFPPHARGWTEGQPNRHAPLDVSPACAGMDRSLARQRDTDSRFPRMRGDGPHYPEGPRAVASFPPHARGWTRFSLGHVRGCHVSPACAGMDRRENQARRRIGRFPRMRGDGPRVILLIQV